MKVKRLPKLLIALCILASIVLSSFATASADTIVLKSSTKVSTSASTERLFFLRQKYENDALAKLTVDTFDIMYMPTSGSAKLLVTVYALSASNYKLAKEQNLLGKLEVSESTGFYLAKRKAANPFPVPQSPMDRSFDYTSFNDYQAWIDGFLTSKGVSGVKATRSNIIGRNASYHLAMPGLQNLTGFRCPNETNGLAKETVVFVYNSGWGNADAVVYKLCVFSATEWADAKTKVIGSQNYIIAENFLGYVFALIGGDTEPYQKGTPDYIAFEAAKTGIKNAVSDVFVFNSQAKTLGVAKTKNLKLGSTNSTKTETILFDAKKHPLFPLRGLVSMIGYQLSWNAKDNVATITYRDKLIAVKKLENSYTSATLAAENNAATAMIDGVPYVDLDFVINNLKCEFRLDDGLIIVNKR